ncbi:c-type cytochrome [Larkinella terrae]|uniref:C-type cytochrome n=1 Tax=Larkinella terrae TaxID=2025311 RepID=A0A7K0EJP5_9BACT|nr:cytochrome c [Larkinella terrae]MRS62059.1 c-type cytochrome [Larkinella terrae]
MKKAAICLTVLTLFFESACQNQEELKQEKYFVEGYQLYTEHCANCHQTDGKGLEALYPPIDGSDYLKDKEKVICLIRYGQNEPIVVNGRSFHRPMPANPQLTDIDIAEITTFIYNKWGEENVITDVKETSKILDTCRVQREKTKVLN